MDSIIPDIDISVLGPEIIILVTAVVVLLLGLSSNYRRWTPTLALLGIVISFYDIYFLWNRNRGSFYGMGLADNFALLFDVIILIGTLLTILLSGNFINQYARGAGEYLSLILFATVGMMLMASSGDLIVIFLGLETLSISLYILTGFRRNRADSLEAGLKYLLLGAFATGFLLYGIALIYGSLGTTNLFEIQRLIRFENVETGILLYAGIGLLLVGFGFKIAIVPFHMWVPDVYEGAATPITAFMSAGVKAASFAVLLRLFMSGIDFSGTNMYGALEVLAILTMTTGNIIALAQSNIKRMLAYSSIAHAGYILVGLTAFALQSESAGASIVYYLLTYTFMNIGAFGVIIYMEKSDEELLSIKDYSGLGFKKPLVAICMTVCLLSLTGIPPTAGFMGKFYIFSSAIDSGLYLLTVISVLNAVVAAYYYIRIIVLMYMKEAHLDYSHATGKPIMSLGLSITVAGIVYFGIFPQSFIGFLLNLFK